MATSGGGWAFHDKLGSAATFTASVSAQTGFPLTNLQNARLLDVCRLAVGSLTDVDVTIDFGANITADTFALLGTNLTTAATRRFRFSTVSDFSTTVIDTGASLSAAFDTSLGSLLESPPPWGRHLIYVNATQETGRYARWRITDAANPDNYLEAAIGRAGAMFQPGYSFTEDWQAGDKLVGDAGNQKILRGHKLTFKSLTAAENAKVKTLARGLYGSGRVLVIPQPMAPETWLGDALWAVLEKPYEGRPLQKVGHKGYWSVDLHFREVDE